jgi:hypothetical protein
MNIQTLEQVSESNLKKIKELNIKSEATEIDFKEIYKISDKKSKVEFIKDIKSFANSKGGYVIFGVNNNSEWIGLDDRSDDDIDDASIQNIIDEYVEGEIEIISNIVEIDNKSFFAIYIFPSKDILTFKKDGQFAKKTWGKVKKETNDFAFKKNDVYCRRGSRSIKADKLFFQKKSVGFKIIENVLNQKNIYNEFIGRQAYIHDLYLKLQNPNNRIIQIDGIGGIGKTSYVHFFCKQLIENTAFKTDFEYIIWTSSKRNRYTPKGISNITEFISNYYDLISDVYKFLSDKNLIDTGFSDEEAEEIVLNFFEKNNVLLIVDNLETLNDTDLLKLLENFPSKSKAILTTRETLGYFYMARINLEGFKEEIEFPEFLDSQYKFYAASEQRFSKIYNNSLKELYAYTKGMPLAGQLITHQISQNTPIEVVIKNLESGDAYHDILTFCFEGSISKLNNEERIVLYILSLSESEDLLSADDISYISSLNIDEIGFNILPKLSSISLALSYKNGEQTIGYSLPHLAKIYIKKFLNLDNEKEVLEKFETFIQERKAFSNGDLSNIQLLSRSNASNHKEKVASNQALRALSISNFDYDVAIGHINELIKRINKFPFLYLIKGKIQDNSFLPDAYTLAKQEFLIAIDLDNHFTEALVELGYLELKNRVGKNKTSKEMIFEAIKYFTKVLDNEPKNHRAHLGLGQAFAAQSKDINYHYHREEKYSKAKLANDHFEKSYYTDDKITPTQVHSNAITAFNQALNLMKNLRDFQKAFEIASKGLTFEPKNSKLLNLQQDLSYKLNPEEYSKKLFTEKGWLKK